MKTHAPSFLKIVAEAKKNVRECLIADLAELQKDGTAHVLVDVREDHEWNKGSIPGALHLSKGIIERDIERIIPNTTTLVVLYCGGGFRSALAAESIQKMGYTQVVSLKGGWSAWKEINP